MNTSASHTPLLTFDFNFYRFTGRRMKPTPVASLEQASSMSSPWSVEEPL